MHMNNMFASLSTAPPVLSGLCTCVGSISKIQTMGLLSDAQERIVCVKLYKSVFYDIFSYSIIILL